MSIKIEVTLSAVQIEQAIREWLDKNNLKVVGKVSFNIDSGYDDRFSYKAPWVKGAKCEVVPTDQDKPFSSLASQIDEVEKSGQQR